MPESCAGPSGSWKTLLPSSSTSVKWWWCPLADTPVNGLGMNVGSRSCLRPDGRADLPVRRDVVRRPDRAVEAEVQLELAGRVLVVAVAHVQAERLPVLDDVEEDRTELLELVDVVAVGLRDALRHLALARLAQPHHLGLDADEEVQPELLLELRDDALEVLARVGVEQLAGLRVVAVAEHAGHARIPGQHGEGVEVGHRGELGLLGAEPDVVAVAVGEEVGGGAVDELIALLGDLGEERRDDALAHDAPGDRYLLEEDVLDALGLDPAGQRLDLLPPARLVAGFLERRGRRGRTSALAARSTLRRRSVHGGIATGVAPPSRLASGIVVSPSPGSMVGGTIPGLNKWVQESGGQTWHDEH